MEKRDGLKKASRFSEVERDASDTGESSLASSTRARRKDSGRQEARRKHALTESLRRAVQYARKLLSSAR